MRSSCRAIQDAVHSKT